MVVVLDLVRNLSEASLGTSARELAQLDVGSVLLVRAKVLPQPLVAGAKQVPDLESG